VPSHPPAYGVGVRAVFVITVLAALGLAGTSSATSTVTDRLTGTEVVPISSTRGTFVGIAKGQLPAAWRVQIVHEPLASGPTVLITGGKFVLVARSGRLLSGAVTAGSVAVRDRGSHCTDQTYSVTTTFSTGSFEGTLTHHRRSIFGRCLVYAATLSGSGTFDV